MSEHNETPWYANDTAVYMGADGGFSLRCCPNPEANARHIVHCVNNHEQLVDLLRELVSSGTAYKLEDFDQCVVDARALLAELDAEEGGEV